MEINWPDLLEKMSELASRVGTGHLEKVFQCLQDLEAVGQKYDKDVRNEAIRFVFELSQQRKL